MRKLLKYICLLFGAIVFAWVNGSAQAIPDGDIISNPATEQQASGNPQSVQGIETSFVKEGEELPPGVMYFNVFKIKNNSNETLEFTIQFDLPARSKIIIQDKDKELILLKPTESRFVPIRVSFPKDVEGGIQHEVIVRLINKEGKEIGASTSASISYQKTSKWRIQTPVSKTYSSSADESFTEISVMLFNEGNTKEDIQIKFDAGNLLVLEESLSGRFNMSVPLRPSTDTTVMVHVRCKPYDESDEVGDKNRLKIEGRSNNDTLVKDLVVIFESINESFRTGLNEAESPLVVSINQGNVTDKATSTNVNLSGIVLLKDERDIKYQFDFQNSFFNQSEFTAGDLLWKKGRFTAEYNSPGNKLRIGDISGGYGYGVSGKGINVKKDLGDTKIGLTLARSANSPVWGIAGEVKRKLTDKIFLQGGITYERDMAEQAQVLASSFGSSISLGDYQRLSFGATALQQSYFGKKEGQETKRGIVYDLGYEVNVGELEVELRNHYVSKNYLDGEGGTFTLDADVGYTMEFENGSHFKVKYEGDLTFTPELSKDSTVAGQNIKTVHGLSSFYNFKVGKLPFSIGGRYDLRLHEKDLYSLDENVKFGTGDLGFNVGTMIKGKNNSDVTFAPTVQFGMTSISHSNDMEAVKNRSLINVKAGLKGRYKTGSFSADYAYGPRLKGQQAATADDPGYGHGLKVAFTNQWDLIPEVLLLQLGGNASYDVSQNELATQLSTDIKYLRDDGWSFNLGASMDPKSAIKNKLSGEKGGLPSINAGARKAFDVPQPRLKYYTLELVFFRDYNGNKEQEKEEDGVSNVLVTAERSPDPVMDNGEIKEIKYNPPSIMSAPSGSVSFYRVPQGAYFLSLKELFPPTQYVNMSGSDLEVRMDKHITLLIPYSKSVTIAGKVEITRDKYSRLNGITPANIRVSVTDANGDQYHSLTGDSGDFIISVPYSEHYKVHMKNVLGDKFDFPDSEQEIEVLEEQIRYEINFHFKEKGRSINF